jgi:mannose-1-phosphate guanylyltransferase
MAKLTVKTAELVRDLEKKVNDLKEKQSSYQADKEEYKRQKQEIIEKAVMRLFSSNVVSSTLQDNKVIVMAEILYSDIGIVEAPKALIEIKDYQIQGAERMLALYSMCTDETISISDQELKAILGW